MEGLNDTTETLMASIARNEAEVSPSTLYATACVLEGVPYVNGAPQNTFVPGLIELAIEKGVLIGEPSTCVLHAPSAAHLCCVDITARSLWRIPEYHVDFTSR